MEMILQNKKSIQSKDILFFIIAITLFTCLYFWSKKSSTDSFFYGASAIEEGTVIERSDSVTTIIIPDKR